MNRSQFMKALRKWSRILHRDLSYFFAGVVLIYAISGFVLNHKRDFNSDYVVKLYNVEVEGNFPMSQGVVTEEYVRRILEPIGEKGNYTKHYFPSENEMKVFLKGGSSLVVDLKRGGALYESFKKRHVISAFNRLHYNPSKAWTVFSDLFVVALIVITLTGLVIVRGPKGLWGRGGIVLLVGMAVPLAFILFM